MSALDILGILNNTRTMLSGLVAWQSVCGVSTAAEAAERIYLGGVEATAEEDTSPLCWIDVNPATFDWMATNRGRVTVEAVLKSAFQKRNAKRIKMNIDTHGRRPVQFWQASMQL